MHLNRYALTPSFQSCAAQWAHKEVRDRCAASERSSATPHARIKGRQQQVDAPRVASRHGVQLCRPGCGEVAPSAMLAAAGGAEAAVQLRRAGTVAALHAVGVWGMSRQRHGEA